MASEPSRRSSAGTVREHRRGSCVAPLRADSDAAFAADTQQYRGDVVNRSRFATRSRLCRGSLLEPHTGINPDLFDASGLARATAPTRNAEPLRQRRRRSDRSAWSHSDLRHAWRSASTVGSGDRLERRTDVVHDRRTGDERSLGHLGLGGVDRHDRVGAGSNDALDDRNDTITFGRDIDRRGARTGRLAPDIDDGGTLVEERERMSDRRLRGAESAAVAERVRGDVDDPSPRHGRPVLTQNARLGVRWQRWHDAGDRRVVELPALRTPSIDMHRCSASITTSTPQFGDAPGIRVTWRSGALHLGPLGEAIDESGTPSPITLPLRFGYRRRAFPMKGSGDAVRMSTSECRTS